MTMLIAYISATAACAFVAYWIGYGSGRGAAYLAGRADEANRYEEEFYPIWYAEGWQDCKDGKLSPPKGII